MRNQQELSTLNDRGHLHRMRPLQAILGPGGEESYGQRSPCNYSAC